MQFAEILDIQGRKLHIGCVMVAGPDWLEISLPRKVGLGAGISIRLTPSQEIHRVFVGWRAKDRVGFTYMGKAPGADEFTRVMQDPHPLSLKRPAP